MQRQFILFFISNRLKLNINKDNWSMLAKKDYYFLNCIQKFQQGLQQHVQPYLQGHLEYDHQGQEHSTHRPNIPQHRFSQLQNQLKLLVVIWLVLLFVKWRLLIVQLQILEKSNYYSKIFVCENRERLYHKSFQPWCSR